MDAESQVTVVTSDNKFVNISREAAGMCKTLSNLMGDLVDDTSPIPVSSVNEETMLLVKRYVEYKRDNPNPPSDADSVRESERRRTDDILPWDKEFMGNLHQSLLFDLIMAANFLECKDLLDLGCKTVANMIKGKSIEELRATFHLKNEFTPEEEEKVRKENEWCDERQ